MKLAEALQERADLKRNIANLRGRLERVVLVQEGEEPVEDPRELLKTLDESVARLEYLMAGGMTLTELIAKKDALLTRLAVYRDLVREAGCITDRASGSEIRVVAVVKASELQKEADRMSREIRVLDNTLQQTNWTVDLVE